MVKYDEKYGSILKKIQHLQVNTQRYTWWWPNRGWNMSWLTLMYITFVITFTWIAVLTDTTILFWMTHNRMTLKDMNKALKAFLEGRSIRHAVHLSRVPQTCLHCRIIPEGNMTMWKSGHTIFKPGEEGDIEARIVWSYSPSHFQVTRTMQSLCMIPMQNFRLECNDNTKNTYYWGMARITKNDVGLNFQERYLCIPRM
jgi:hypothetical protein